MTAKYGVIGLFHSAPPNGRGVEGHAPDSLLLHERCEYYMNAASKAEFRDLSAQHIQTLI
jgi:hypothetical protein